LFTATAYFNTDSEATADSKNKYIRIDVPTVPEKAIDINQMHCLATNIYHEARGETVRGKFAVAHVTMNRVNSDRFPNTVCNVVYQSQMRTNWKGESVPKRHKCQFSWYCDGKSDAIILRTAEGNIIKYNMNAWEESLKVATAVLKHNIHDTTYGATHYFNDKLADPYWADHYVQVAVIDNHVFHRMDTY
tara:strand:- start:132 stop:701 length:570 start_codon:yes stop_codon:yes gene_type:complete